MNRTKTIYFLSAIVLIIGCYALNLSYSLFVQTENRDVVNLTVPSLAYSLETGTYTIPAGSGKLVKLKVLNSGTEDFNYGISTTQADGITVQLVEKTDNAITGTLAASDVSGESSFNEVWVYVTNNNETDTVVTFNIIAKYTTLNFDENFATTSNIDIVNKVKLLNETIIASAKDAVTNNDTSRTLYNDTFNLNSITDISSETDRMLALAEDDYGTSYVFRGAVKDNYVNFAGFTWRIVRINGDGSIRLILDGSLDKVSKDGVAVYTNSNLQAIDSDGIIAFKSSPYNDNAYVGYMYGEFTGNSTSYDEAHQNKKSSTIKTYVDEFYKEYLRLYQDDYIADTLFCGDKTLASASIGSSNKATGFGTGSTNKTYYSAAERLFDSTGTTSITTAKPTLECASSENATDTLTEEQRAYSRYTSNIDSNTTTSKGVLVNNDLTYPIGLLSADELVMAGAFKSDNNTSYYLYVANESEIPELNSWWTMSPYNFSGSYARVFNSTATSYSLYYGFVYNTYGVRPVINLKSDVLIDENGDGTQSNPYVILANDGNSSETETPEEETVTFTFTTTNGNVSEEYTVPKGTTFATFVANNNNKFTYAKYDDDDNNYVKYRSSSTNADYYCSNSESGVVAEDYVVIESGNYICNRNEFVEPGEF